MKNSFSIAIFLLVSGFIASADSGQSDKMAILSTLPSGCFVEGEAVGFDLIYPGKDSDLSGLLRIRDYQDRDVLYSNWDNPLSADYEDEDWRIEGSGNRMRVIWKSAPVGFYVAHWIPDGTEEIAAYLRFAVIPQRDYFGNSPFAMDAAFSWFVDDEKDLMEACRLLKVAGVDWVRDRFSWGQIQPEREQWEWKRYDFSASVQHDAGMQIYQVFHDTAPWAVRTPFKVNDPQRYPPENLNDLDRFLGEMVDRYKDSVRAWEVWNEMDSTAFFAGSAEEYVPLLQKSYWAIKERDPLANVLLGSVCFFEGTHSADGKTYVDREGPRFLEKILECGAGNSFDTYNFHYYGPGDGLIDRFQVDREILDRFGLEDKPVWLTEIGMPGTHPTTSVIQDFEREQADYLVKAYTLGVSLGAEKVFYFIFPSFLEFGRSYWGIYDYQKGQGWGPKPAYVALAQLTHSLGEGKCRGRLEMPDGLRGVLFESGEQNILVVWSLKPEGGMLRLPRSTEYHVEDGLGQPVRISGKRNLEVTLSPLYIQGNFDKLLNQSEFIPTPQLQRKPERFEKLPFTISLRCEPNQVAPGDSVNYTLHIYNETEQVQSGTLKYVMNGGGFDLRRPSTFRVEPKARVEVSFRQIVEKRPLGEKVQKVEILQEGQKVGQAQTYLELIQPVQIISARLVPDASSEKFKLEITAMNHSSRFRSPVVELSSDVGEGIDQRFNFGEIAPGERKTISRSFPENLSPGNLYLFKCGDVVFRSYLDSPVVTLLDRLPKIDGKFDEEGFPKWHLWKREQCAHGADIWKGKEDLSGEVNIGMTPQGIYIAGRVKDDDSCPPVGDQQPWTGDAVELFFDFRMVNLGKPFYGDGVYQIFIVPPTDSWPKGRVALWQPEIRELSDVELKVRMKKDGYDFEVLIPFDQLPDSLMKDSFELNSVVGRVFAMDVVLDDRDRYEGRHKQMAWQGTSENWRDPSGFAKVILCPPYAVSDNK